MALNHDILWNYKFFQKVPTCTIIVGYEQIWCSFIPFLGRRLSSNLILVLKILIREKWDKVTPQDSSPINFTLFLMPVHALPTTLVHGPMGPKCILNTFGAHGHKMRISKTFGNCKKNVNRSEHLNPLTLTIRCSRARSPWLRQPNSIATEKKG